MPTEKERITVWNHQSPKNGDYILYWMQASQRVAYNHALNFAIEEANRLKLPVLVVFGLTPHYPRANLRHYVFMLEGLQETFTELNKLGIGVKLEMADPPDVAITYAQKAALVVMDRGYTKIQKYWRKKVANAVNCPCYEIESEVIVPVEIVSPQEEYAASTIRKKIRTHLSNFLRRVDLLHPHHPYPVEERSSIDIPLLLKKLSCDRSVTPSPIYQGGYTQAKKWLEQFIRHKLAFYGKLRNDPSADYQSHLSPYLHFGQIAAQEVAIEVQKANTDQCGPFLEELIIRRELACNFVYYNENYESYWCLPDWAKKTLEKHRCDRRPYLYSLEELEFAQTHDSYWNAAQREMLMVGKMHNYMRMYWGKKVIEWTKSPEEAYGYLIYLNDKYELDGRDPNGYAGIAWCFGKHDRPWSERPIFGYVRYMNASGLERKFDMEKYLQKIQELE